LLLAKKAKFSSNFMSKPWHIIPWSNKLMKW
jgi:hypothetical protein